MNERIAGFNEAFLAVSIATKRLCDINITLTKHPHVKVGGLIMCLNVQLNISS